MVATRSAGSQSPRCRGSMSESRSPRSFSSASFAGTLVTLAHASRPSAQSPLTLDITGHQWWWEVRYSDSLAGDGFVTANEVHIPVGVPVRLRFHGADVIHSWWIPELAGKTDLIPGQVNTSWFEAREPGEYRGQCAEYCGLEHAKMGAIVFADPPAQFAQWAAQQRASATSPADSTAHVGSLVFERSCSACHAVRGTDAEGRVGPDLTHLGEPHDDRRRFAAKHRCDAARMDPESAG